MSKLELKAELSRTKIILLATGAFLGGLALAKLGLVADWVSFAIAVLSAPLVFKDRRFLFVILPLIFMLLGVVRGQAALKSFNPITQRYEQNVAVNGRVAADTLITDKFQTEFILSSIKIESNNRQIDSGGRILVRGFAQNKINRGDIVSVAGKLRPTLGNYQGQINFAEISIIGKKVAWHETLRRRFFAGVFSTIPEPAGSLGLGFLVGARALLPDSLNKQLAITGLTHIVAVSGYNLTILVRFTRRMFANTSKYLATLASTLLIGAFLVATGSSPSVSRAAVVSGLALLAWYYGRQVKPSVLIFLSAAITAAANPTYLWFDIGWYLSFLAFFGVLVIAPALNRKLFPKIYKRNIPQLLSETFSAQLMTLPLIMYIFGKASLIAVPANLLVLPLIPLAMVLTFIAGIGHMLVAPLAGWLAAPAVSVMHLLIVIVEKFAAIPGALKSVQISGWQMVAIYVSLIIFAVSIRATNKKSLARYSVID